MIRVSAEAVEEQSADSDNRQVFLVKVAAAAEPQFGSDHIREHGAMAATLASL